MILDSPFTTFKVSFYQSGIEMGGFDFGKVFLSADVKATLNESGVTENTLLENHSVSHPDEKNGWVISSFELPKLDRTVWTITDLKQQSTSFFLEEP